MSVEVMIDLIGALTARIPRVKFAYVFGSYARGNHGLTSDIDIAVSPDRRLSPFSLLLRLIKTMTRELGTERFDLIILNDAPPVLKCEVVRQGRMIKEEKRRIEFEAKAFGEYGHRTLAAHPAGVSQRTTDAVRFFWSIRRFW